ncbi:MAG TPA: radical SAM protein [Methylomirabilota bacterium]|jgi:AdoMet-dependent heme synthase|nr:radical SAM protein [Methylomirabilota bacterium]
MDAPAPAAPLTSSTPSVPFRHLTALWVQITGTWCNLQCAHCLNASGPKNPWLAALDAAETQRWIEEAATLGVKEIYFTGGEPFLHPEIEAMLAFALHRAPTTVLTNGTLIDEAMAGALAALAAGARYSLEIRVSLDDPDRARNDAIRGRGAFDRALAAMRRLHERGLLPILTATEVEAAPPGAARYDRLRRLLLDAGVTRPRVKILPLFPVGRVAGSGGGHVTAEMLAAVDPARLQCSESRAVAAGGIYVCPILSGLSEARLPVRSLAESLTPTALTHPACLVCWQTGASCRNG